MSKKKQNQQRCSFNFCLRQACLVMSKSSQSCRYHVIRHHHHFRLFHHLSSSSSSCTLPLLFFLCLHIINGISSTPFSSASSAFTFPFPLSPLATSSCRRPFPIPFPIPIPIPFSPLGATSPSITTGITCLPQPLTVSHSSAASQ